MAKSQDDKDKQGTLFGTAPFKLARRDDPDTSHEAAESVDTTKLEGMVYDAIVSFGAEGCISDELRHRFWMFPYSSITARYKALMEKKLIFDTEERRPGDSGKNQRVMCATRFLKKAQATVESANYRTRQEDSCAPVSLPRN